MIVAAIWTTSVQSKVRMFALELPGTSVLSTAILQQGEEMFASAGKREQRARLL